MLTLQQVQESFEQAQQEVMQAQTELEVLMQEAPLPVMPVAQVNVSLVKTLEALTGIIENLWNPDAGQPPDHLIHMQSRSRGQILQTSSVIHVSGGWRSFGYRAGRRTGSRALGLGDGGQSSRLLRPSCLEEMADFKETHAPGGPPIEVTMSSACKAATREYSDNTTAEEDAHHGAGGSGAGRSPVLTGPKVVSTSHDESQRHGTSGVVATCMCDHPSNWQVPGVLARTQGDICQPVLTGCAGTQARDR